MFSEPPQVRRTQTGSSPGRPPRSRYFKCVRGAASGRGASLLSLAPTRAAEQVPWAPDGSSDLPLTANLSAAPLVSLLVWIFGRVKGKKIQLSEGDAREMTVARRPPRL